MQNLLADVIVGVGTKFDSGNYEPTDLFLFQRVDEMLRRLNKLRKNTMKFYEIMI